MNIYDKAIMAQSACNLSGLVHSLATIVTEIRADPDCTGTDYVNQHPVVVLFVAQMMHLSAGLTMDGEAYMAAYAVCNARMKGPNP